MVGDRGPLAACLVALRAGDAGVVEVVADLPAGIVPLADLMLLMAGDSRVGGSTVPAGWQSTHFMPA